MLAPLTPARRRPAGRCWPGTGYRGRRHRDHARRGCARSASRGRPSSPPTTATHRRRLPRPGRAGRSTTCVPAIDRGARRPTSRCSSPRRRRWPATGSCGCCRSWPTRPGPGPRPGCCCVPARRPEPAMLDQRPAAADLPGQPVAVAARSAGSRPRHRGRHRPMIDAEGRCRARSSALVDDLRDQVASDAGAAHRAAQEYGGREARRTHRRHLRDLAGRRARPGRGGLGAGLRLRPLLRGQRPGRAAVDRRARAERAGRAGGAGTGRRTSIANPLRQRPALAAGGVRATCAGCRPPASSSTSTTRCGGSTSPATRPRRCPTSSARGAGARLASRPGAGHPVPRRPLPGPVGARPEDVRAAADAGVRRGVHPRPDADPAVAEFGLADDVGDRPDLRVGPLPARRVRPAAAAVEGPRAGRPTCGSWSSGRWTRCTASTSTRSRSRSPGSG